MAPIIAPGVCRFVINGTYGGEDVANIVDMLIDTTGSTDSRGDAIFAQAGILINEWSDSVLPVLVDEYVATSVSWIDLDSINGTTGERTTTSQETWPQAGTDTGSPMPGNVAARINKNTVALRGQRQGRLYLVGIPESYTLNDPNRLNPSVVTGLNVNFSNFLGDINQVTTGTSYESKMVVVHTAGGVFSSHSDVDSLTCDGKLGSQSRRLR